MVGRAVASHCGARNDEVLAATHASLDIADASAVESIIEGFRPEAVINCAAWTDVDACESNARRAFAVNSGRGLPSNWSSINNNFYGLCFRWYEGGVLYPERRSKSP
jgi:hypothetical protein